MAGAEAVMNIDGDLSKLCENVDMKCEDRQQERVSNPVDDTNNQKGSMADSEKKGGMGDCRKKDDAVRTAEVRPISVDNVESAPEKLISEDDNNHYPGQQSVAGAMTTSAACSTQCSDKHTTDTSNIQSSDVFFSMSSSGNTARSEKLINELLRMGILHRVEVPQCVTKATTTGTDTASARTGTEKLVDAIHLESVDVNEFSIDSMICELDSDATGDSSDSEDVAYTPAVACGRRMMKQLGTPDSPLVSTPRMSLQKLKIFQCNVIPLLEDAYRMLYVLDRVREWSRNISSELEPGDLTERCAALVYLWVVRIFLPAMDENVSYQRELCGLGKMYPLSVARFFVALAIRSTLEEADMEQEFDDAMLELFPMDKNNFDTFFYSCCLNVVDPDGEASVDHTKDTTNQMNDNTEAGTNGITDGGSADFAIVGTSMPLTNEEGTSTVTTATAEKDNTTSVGPNAFKYSSLDEPLNNMLDTLRSGQQSGILPSVLSKYIQPSSDTGVTENGGDDIPRTIRTLEEFQLPTRLLLLFCDASADVLLELMEKEESRLMDCIKMDNSSPTAGPPTTLDTSQDEDLSESLGNLQIDDNSTTSKNEQHAKEETCASKDERQINKDRGEVTECMWEKAEQALLEEFIRLVFYQL